MSPRAASGCLGWEHGHPLFFAGVVYAAIVCGVGACWRDGRYCSFFFRAVGGWFEVCIPRRKDGVGEVLGQEKNTKWHGAGGVYLRTPNSDCVYVKGADGDAGAIRRYRPVVVPVAVSNFVATTCGPASRCLCVVLSLLAFASCLVSLPIVLCCVRE